MLFFEDAKKLKNNKIENNVSAAPITASEAHRLSEEFWLDKTAIAKESNEIFQHIRSAISKGELSCSYESESPINHNCINYLKTLGFLCVNKGINRYTISW